MAKPFSRCPLRLLSLVSLAGTIGISCLTQNRRLVYDLVQTPEIKQQRCRGEPRNQEEVRSAAARIASKERLVAGGNGGSPRDQSRLSVRNGNWEARSQSHRPESACGRARNYAFQALGRHLNDSAYLRGFEASRCWADFSLWRRFLLGMTNFSCAYRSCLL